MSNSVKRKKQKKEKQKKKGAVSASGNTTLPLLQRHPKRRLIPDKVCLLINPIGALRTQRDIKVEEQFAEDKTDFGQRKPLKSISS